MERLESVIILRNQQVAGSIPAGGSKGIISLQALKVAGSALG
jgi:hypothetical protein